MTHQPSDATQVDQFRDRIRRALEKIKSARRYSVQCGYGSTIWWDFIENGPLTDSRDVDKVIEILEEAG